MLMQVMHRPHKDKEEDKIFYKQLGKVSQLLAFVLMGDLEISAGNTLQLRGDSLGGLWSVWKKGLKEYSGN